MRADERREVATPRDRSDPGRSPLEGSTDRAGTGGEDLISERTVRVERDGRLVAEVTVSAVDGEACAQVTVVPGHLPAGTRRRVADAVRDAAVEDDASRVTAAVPIGDAELIAEVRGQLGEAELRPAGATCLIRGAVERSGPASRR